MKDTKFTPGPWCVPHFADDTHPCMCISVVGMHGGMGGICDIEIDNGLLISEGGNDAPDIEQAKANAHLIAAAPDLYEALEWAVLNADESEAGRDDEWYANFERCAAALAKARGEE